MNDKIQLDFDTAQEMEAMMRMIVNAIVTKGLDDLVAAGLCEAVETFADIVESALEDVREGV